MKISELAHALSGLLDSMTLSEPETQVHAVSLFPSDIPNSDVLYLLESAPAVLPQNLAVRSDPTGGINVLRLKNGTFFEALELACQRLLLDEVRIDAQCSRFSRQLLQCQDLAAVVKQASDFLGHSLLLFDYSFYCLARSIRPDAELTALTASDYLPDEVIRAFRYSGMGIQLSRSGSGFLQEKSTVLNRDTLLTSICVHGVPIGYLMMIDGAPALPLPTGPVFPFCAGWRSRCI